MILALDLSTKSSGWAVYDKNNLIASGCITATSSDLIERIIKITKELDEKILKKYKIHEVIAEEVQPTGGYGVGNQKTHKALMWIQASIALLLHQYHIKFNFVYPNSWRAQCGIKTRPRYYQRNIKTKRYWIC